MASFPTGNYILNLKAGSDLSSSRFKALVLASDGEVDVAGVNAKSIGFLMNTPTAGQVCEIAGSGGGAKAIAGGTINAGDLLATDANGDLLVGTANQILVARALEGAVDGDIFAVEPILAFSGTSTTV